MAEREASGDFDYLPDEAMADAPADRWDEAEGPLWREETDGDARGSFNAFDASTWYFEPAPTPWYRTRRAMTTLLAAATAAVALVVSAVLLVVDGPRTVVEESTSVRPSAPATVASTRSATSRPESPPAPPPPPETSAASIAPQPVQTYRPQSPTRTTRTTKEPEIGVTRTPETRSPISVAPQRPGRRE